MASHIDIKFHGIDFWNRPVYKVEGMEVFVGSTDVLFSGTDTKEEIDNYFKDNLEELVIFGSTFDEHDPLGTRIKKDIKINII